MELKEDYLINAKTVLIYGYRYENGYLYTFVIDGEDMFIVAMSPYQLIEKSLICYGSNFKGALKSSQKLLGKNKRKYPIKIDASLDIWLFPTKSYKKENCVCFILKHIKNTIPLGPNCTTIFLNYGHTFEIAMRESAFRDKCWLTEDLKDKIISNHKKSLNFEVEPKKGFMIVERKGTYKFKQIKK